MDRQSRTLLGAGLYLIGKLETMIELALETPMDLRECADREYVSLASVTDRDNKLSLGVKATTTGMRLKLHVECVDQEVAGLLSEWALGRFDFDDNLVPEVTVTGFAVDVTKYFVKRGRVVSESAHF